MLPPMVSSMTSLRWNSIASCPSKKMPALKLQRPEKGQALSYAGLQQRAATSRTTLAELLAPLLLLPLKWRSPQGRGAAVLTILGNESNLDPVQAQK